MALKVSYDQNIKVLTTIPGWAEQLNQASPTTTVDAYKNSVWAFRAVSIRADAIASAPLKLYKPTKGEGGEDSTEEITDHPVLDLLDRVNNEWNKGDLWRYTESAFCVYGAAYWQKVRAGKKNAEIMFLNPRHTKPVMGQRGVEGFEYRQDENFQAFDRDEVVYFRGAYDPLSDLSGLAPMSLASLAANGEHKADQYIEAFFSNFAVPPLILTTEQPLGESALQQVRDWWKKLFGGVKNQFKTGILGSGLKPVPLSSPLKDLALSEVRSEFHRTICVALGVDELLLSATGAADRTPVDAALYHLYVTTIIPRWKYYEEVLNAELLPDYPDLVKAEAYFEFDQGEVKPLQDDQNQWAQTLATLKGQSILKPETIADELGYELSDVPGYDENGKKLPEPELPTMVVGPDGKPKPAPGQTPPQLAGSAQAAQSAARQPNKPQEAKPQEGKAAELARWERKAIRQLKAGKALEFSSQVLDPDTIEFVEESLALCETVEEIKAVFELVAAVDGSTPAAADPLLELARSLDRATKALEDTKDL